MRGQTRWWGLVPVLGCLSGSSFAQDPPPSETEGKVSPEEEAAEEPTPDASVTTTTPPTITMRADIDGLTLEDAQMILQIEAQRLPPQALREFIHAPEAARRARAARALGRLRTTEALSPLRLLIDAPEPEVRWEAAFALGQTPGGGMVAQARLAVETDVAVRAALCEALSKQGGSTTVQALMDALTERAGPLQSPVVATAAATGLGRMARRGIEGVAAPDVLRALVAQLDRLSPELRRASAYALAQIRPPSPPPEVAAAMLDRLRRSSGDPEVRKQLLYATADFSRTPAERDALYLPLVTDSSEDVRVALARVSGRVGWPGVTALLADRTLGVRLEAIAAVARVEGLDQGRLLLPLLQQGGTLEADEALRTAGDTAILEAAAALSALGSSPLEGVPALLGNADAYLQPKRPGRIRVAAAGVSKDTQRLAELARKDGEIAVRTAAAARLTELDPPTALMILVLKDAFDPTVRAIAADWLAEHPAASAEAALLDALSDAQDLDLLVSAGKGLAALYGGASPKVRRPDAAARTQARALAGHADLQVQAAGKALADALDIDVVSGSHGVISAPLEEVLTIRAARIQTSRGEAIVALYPEEAPVTVWNFARLAEEGFYNGLTIHRVVPDFVVQDGDPRGDGAGGPGYTIPDEINPRPYAEGALGMAHAGPDTGGSQWFVTLSPQPHLDGLHTVFGQVQRGQQVFRDLRPGDRIERILIERYP